MRNHGLDNIFYRHGSVSPSEAESEMPKGLLGTNGIGIVSASVRPAIYATWFELISSSDRR